MGKNHFFKLISKLYYFPRNVDFFGHMGKKLFYQSDLKNTFFSFGIYVEKEDLKKSTFSLNFEIFEEMNQHRQFEINLKMTLFSSRR